MPFQQTLTDNQIYQHIRQVIDNGQVDEMISIFNDYPDLDWNHITPNRLSALWWALTPPQGKGINTDVIAILLGFRRNNHQLAIDPSQQYADLRPDYYLKQFSTDAAAEELLEIIREAQGEFTRRNRISQNQTDGLATDTHSASNPFVVRASDENLKRLYQRYKEILVVNDEIKEIETFIKSPDFQKAFPLASQKEYILKALHRFKTDPTQRSIMTPETGPCNLREALALTWLAAKETNPELVANTDPFDRQNAILTALFEAKTAYVGGGFSCWQGIWGRIGTTLSYLHGDVHYQDIKLTGELARDKCTALIGEVIAKAYEQDNATYWSILRTRLSLENNEDTILAKAWWNNILPAVKQTMYQANIEPDEINKLLADITDVDMIPLSRHEPGRQLELLQRFFHQHQKVPLFAFNGANDINHTLESLKTTFIKECLQLPDHISNLQLNAEKIAQIAQWVLNTLLTRCSEDEGIDIADIWNVVRTQLKIDDLKNDAFSNWYKALELTKQIELALYCLNKDSFSLSNVVEWTITHSHITGLSLKGMDLTGKDFRGWDLSGIDFRGADLRKADLRLINANGTLWDECNLMDTDFNQFIFPEALLVSSQCMKEFLLKSDNEGSTLLHALVKKNNHDQIRSLVNSKHCSEDLLMVKNINGTPLYGAALRGEREIIKTILDSPYFTERVLAAPQNKNKESVLQVLSEERYLPLAKSIITSSRCTEEILAARDKDNNTVLHTAFNHSTNLLALLITLPSCTENILMAKNKDGDTILHQYIKMMMTAREISHRVETEQNARKITEYAIKRTCAYDIRSLIESPGCTDNVLIAQNANGEMAMSTLIEKGNTHLVESMILSQHCTEKVLSGQNNTTLLHQCMKKLLEAESVDNNPDVKTRIKNKYKHLAYAIITSPSCTENILLWQNENDETVLHIAIKNGYSDIAQTIITSKHCTDKVLAVTDDGNKTVLHLAVEKGYSTLAEPIIKNRKKYFLIGLKEWLSGDNITRKDILELFKEMKDKNGKYAYVHEYKNSSLNKFRLFFKSSANNEKDFFHTMTYQNAIKLLKDAYIAKKDKKISDENIADEKYFINYYRGNSPMHPLPTSTSRKIL